MDDGCREHWQWRLGEEHVAHFYDHSPGEAISAAHAYADRNGLWLVEIEIRKLVGNWASEWESVADWNEDSDEPVVIIQPAGLLSAMAEQ